MHRLADTGVYVASESTMYRRMRQEGQLTHRRSERATQKRSRPRTLAATGPDPYIESAFRTLKYRPELPVKPFEDLLAARRWVTELAHWYGPRASPQRHRLRNTGAAPCRLGQRPAWQRALVYERARQENPQRWSGQARQWAHVDVVHLNPETPHIKELRNTQKVA